MLEFFGPVTPVLLFSIVTGVTQFIKSQFQLSGKVVQFVALVLSLILVIPYHLLTADEITALVSFQAVVYSLAGWLMSIGLYEALKRNA